MNFTGSLNNLFRNFYTQTGNFGFLVSCTADNTTGNYNFGVTGNNNINFAMNSGFLYYNNLLLHSYLPNQNFVTEVQVNTGKLNVIKDGVPLIYGMTIPTGNYNYFYFNRSNASLGATFDLFVSGDNKANYSIQNVGYIFNTGQTSVSGLVTNNAPYPVNIFQSTAYNPQNLVFVPITGNVGTGAFYFSGNYANLSSTNPVSMAFNTNYDDPFFTFTIVDLTTQQLVVVFQPISNYIMSANQLTRTLYYNNYSGGAQSNFPTNLYFQLTYLTGSGSFAEGGFAPTANFTDQVYGNITGSGYLTGQVVIPTGNSTLTGNYIINVTRFQWATGLVTGFYSGMATGQGTGAGYTGRAVGVSSGYYVGTIFNNSGSLIVNSTLTGNASNVVSLDYPNYTNATGYINIQKLQYNDIIYLGNNTPLIKGFQFFNETGLITYLSGNSPLMNGYFSGNNIYLTSKLNGTAGNGLFITGQFCDIGSLSGSTGLIGGTNIGSTGTVLNPTSNFTGGYNFALTGSGNYTTIVSGIGAGTFFYTTTFTGAWSLFSGIDIYHLVQFQETSSSAISGSGIFQPNSSVAFSVSNKQNIFLQAGALLTISGQNVSNPIQVALYN